jgi:hypothetical protein
VFKSAGNKKKEVVMNSLEEIARIVMRMRDLREKIEGENSVKSTWPQRIELGVLKARLERMKQKLLKEV